MFQRWTEGWPCSHPSSLTAAVPRPNSLPCVPGSPSHRAARTRRTCPWAKARAGAPPVRPSTRCTTRSAPRHHLGGPFAPRPGAGPDGPTRVVSPYLVDGEPLQVSIVPLHQVLVDFGPEPGHLSRAPGPTARTGQDQLVRAAAQGRGQIPGLPLPTLGQGHVGVAGVTARSAPLRLPVPDQPQPRSFRHPA